MASQHLHLLCIDPVKRIELLDEVTQSCELEPKFRSDVDLAVCPVELVKNCKG